MESIYLDSDTFTVLCDAVEKGEEITFFGTDYGENRGTMITLPARIVGNLTIDPDDADVLEGAADPPEE